MKSCIIEKLNYEKRQSKSKTLAFDYYLTNTNFVSEERFSSIK